MKNIYLKASILVFFSIFIYSCSSDDDPQETTAPVDVIETFGIRHDKTLAEYEAIVTATGDYPNFDSVVFLQWEDANGDAFNGSGVLINEQWVLTAGHNFFSNGDASSVTADKIDVKFGNDPNDANTLFLEVETIVLHPTWVATGGDIFGGNDLCLLKLSNPITNVTPVSLFTNNSAQIGSQVWVSGFGDYSQQTGQDADADSKKHAYHNVLDRKTDDKPSTINGTTYSGGHLAYDFDNPSGTVNTLGDANNTTDEMDLFPGGGTSSSELLDFEAGSVTGDSGGPIFIKDGDVWKVAGVLSGGTQDPIPGHVTSGYGDISLFTRTFPMLTWIQQTIE
jgi:V8-like Glu-specific endopeptidase